MVVLTAIMRIYLIRHGRPEIINGEFYKSKLGKRGIKECQDFIKNDYIPKPDKIFSSPYNRTIDTASVISKEFSMNFEENQDLREWDLQSLNLQEDYMEEEEKGWNNHALKVKGGESLNDVTNRIKKCVEKIIKDNPKSKNILLVSHGTIIDLFCCSIGSRSPKIEDIRVSQYLDYAIIKYVKNEFTLIKDIL